MSYTREGSRGGRGCCRNQNGTGKLPIEEAVMLNDDFHDDEIEDDNENNDWHVTEDKSFTEMSGKYESMDPNSLADQKEEATFLDAYLMSMSPLIDGKQNKHEKGKFGSLRAQSGGPHDVSVKCSNSTEEIIGSPSKVALRLNDALKNYLPRRRMKIEDEVSNEVSDTLRDDPGEGSMENIDYRPCPGQEIPYTSDPPPEGCPGTYDRMNKQMVSCSDALTLREIALGRRMEKESRPFLPTNDDRDASRLYPRPMIDPHASKSKESCCCTKKKKKKSTQEPPPAPVHCCSRQSKANKIVSFSL